MKVSSIFALLFATSAFSAPQGTISNPGPDVGVNDTICTTEYDPTTCEYQGLRFDGTNACRARAALQRYAKFHNLVLEEDAIVCTSGEVL